MTFDELERAYFQFLILDDDPLLVRLLYSSFLANWYDGNPLWMMIVGPAGCGKSELLMSMSESDKSYAIDALNANSLLSGFQDKNSLLPKINGRVLIIKDFSSVTQMYGEARAQLFSLLRSAYDGYLERGTGKGLLTWKGKFGLLVGATPIVEQSRSMESSLGERFLTIRPRIVSSDEVLEREMSTSASKKSIRQEIKNKATEFLNEFTLPSVRTLPRSVVTTLKASAKCLVKIRSGVVRNNYTKEIEFPAEVGELATRVFGQMTILSLAARALGTEHHELELMAERFLLDAIPYSRRRVVAAIAEGLESTSDIAESVKVSSNYVGRMLEELLYLDVVQRKNKGYSLTDEILGQALTRKS